MLSSFHIQNFRSILDLKLDFSYGEGKAPNGWQKQDILPFLESGTKRLVPCMAFFGANAAGKTNILKAASALRKLVINGRVTLPTLFEPNLLNRQFVATTFGLKFLLGTECFEYKVTYNAGQILHEHLWKDGKPIYEINDLKGDFSHHIISTSYTEEKLRDILKVECSDGARQIKTFLHRIGNGYLGLHNDTKTAFIFFKNLFKTFDGGNTPIDFALTLPVAVDVLASVLGGDEELALHKITDVIRRLDLDITKLVIVKRLMAEDEEHPDGIPMTISQTGTKHALSIETTHLDSDGNPTVLDFMKHASAGTQKLASIVGLVLYALETGGALLVDELESSLHPLLIREIVLLFKKRRYNKKGAQLIFTTHNTDILDDSILRLSEIALVRKTTANGTLVRRLVDLKNEGEDIRNVTNFRKQYLAGFYSGVPHPAL